MSAPLDMPALPSAVTLGPDPQRKAVPARRIRALYVTVDSIRALVGLGEARHSPIGIGPAAASLVIRPVLSAAQRRAGRELGSASAVADSEQTLLCTYLSAVLLVGLLLNSLFGRSWADPIAALVIAAIAVKAGINAWRGTPAAPPRPRSPSPIVTLTTATAATESVLRPLPADHMLPYPSTPRYCVRLCCPHRSWCSSHTPEELPQFAARVHRHRLLGAAQPGAALAIGVLFLGRTIPISRKDRARPVSRLPRGRATTTKCAPRTAPPTVRPRASVPPPAVSEPDRAGDGRWLCAVLDSAMLFASRGNPPRIGEGVRSASHVHLGGGVERYVYVVVVIGGRAPTVLHVRPTAAIVVPLLPDHVGHTETVLPGQHEIGDRVAARGIGCHEIQGQTGTMVAVASADGAADVGDPECLVDQVAHSCHVRPCAGQFRRTWDRGRWRGRVLLCVPGRRLRLVNRGRWYRRSNRRRRSRRGRVEGGSRRRIDRRSGLSSRAGLEHYPQRDHDSARDHASGQGSKHPGSGWFAVLTRHDDDNPIRSETRSPLDYKMVALMSRPGSGVLELPAIRPATGRECPASARSASADTFGRGVSPRVRAVRRRSGSDLLEEVAALGAELP